MTNLFPALPRVTIEGKDPLIVEIGGAVYVVCNGSSVFDDVTVSWTQIVDGEERPGTNDCTPTH